ncbi:MAG: hypothetical protein HN608_00590, partial [Rhodospirillaceae bacterium]|nr:hypothetical protein [Rhodospirillaceae bacterium]
MSGNLVETLIGAVVLVVAGFFLYFSYDKADVGAVEGYSLTAKFDKVDGVKVGFLSYIDPLNRTNNLSADQLKDNL